MPQNPKSENSKAEQSECSSIGGVTLNHLFESQQLSSVISSHVEMSSQKSGPVNNMNSIVESTKKKSSDLEVVENNQDQKESAKVEDQQDDIDSQQNSSSNQTSSIGENFESNTKINQPMTERSGIKNTTSLDLLA